MIEIVFSDSACGSLKMAQGFGKGPYSGGRPGIDITPVTGNNPTPEEIEEAQRVAKEYHRRVWENATPFGGSTADVFGFNLTLSIGDITENPPGPLRLQALKNLYSMYPHDEGDQAAAMLMEMAENNRKTVCSRAARGEPLRIWYSNQPDELCGLYWLLAQLNQSERGFGPVHLIKLPEWETDEHGNTLRRTAWAEIPPWEWHRYLDLQKTAPPTFCQSCADHWKTLQEENALLRAMLNGQLVSVPTNLYDDFITREIDAEDDEFQEVRVIGRVIGNYQLGISDSWVALRIEEMIRAGKLAVVTASDADAPTYHRVLRKVPSAWS